MVIYSIVVTIIAVGFVIAALVMTWLFTPVDNGQWLGSTPNATEKEAADDVWRERHKAGTESLKKAVWYLQLLINLDEEKR